MALYLGRKWKYFRVAEIQCRLRGGWSGRNNILDRTINVPSIRSPFLPAFPPVHSHYLRIIADGRRLLRLVRANSISSGARLGRAGKNDVEPDVVTGSPATRKRLNFSCNPLAFRGVESRLSRYTVRTYVYMYTSTADKMRKRDAWQNLNPPPTSTLHAPPRDFYRAPWNITIPGRSIFLRKLNYPSA